jgi:hypothetical protein
MADTFSSQFDAAVTDVELQQLENVHQARILINQIEQSCTEVWEAFEKLEEIKRQAEEIVKIIPEVKSHKFPVQQRLWFDREMETERFLNLDIS